MSIVSRDTLSEKVFPELVSSLLSSFNDWSDEDFAAFLASVTGDKVLAFVSPDSKELTDAREALAEMLNKAKSNVFNFYTVGSNGEQ